LISWSGICRFLFKKRRNRQNGTYAVQKNSSRQRSLFELTGGSPRLTVMLFEQIAKGFSSNINDDLEILADAITPLYKARFEELPVQQQIIIDAIALNWDAISLNKLSIATRMQNDQLSPQLKRLMNDGWIETTPAYKAKGNAYFISERFFNIYYNIVLSPYYTAIQALEIEQQDGKNGKGNAEIYLKNRAVEISDPARIIVERIKKYLLS
jgi:hypothetical protein